MGLMDDVHLSFRHGQLQARAPLCSCTFATFDFQQQFGRCAAQLNNLACTVIPRMANLIYDLPCIFSFPQIPNTSLMC